MSNRILFPTFFNHSDNVNWLLPSPELILGNTSLLTVDISELSSLGRENYNSFYTLQERSEIGRLTNESRRNEKLAGKLAVKMLAFDLFDNYHKEMSDFFSIEILSENTPVLVNLSKELYLNIRQGIVHASISHSENILAAVVSDEKIGLDIEKLQIIDENLTEAIVDKISKISIIRYCSQNDSDDFYNEYIPLIVFTQKEAVLKCAGIGLTEDLNNLVLENFIPGGCSLLKHDNIQYRVWTEILNGCIYSVATMLHDKPV